MKEAGPSRQTDAVHPRLSAINPRSAMETTHSVGIDLGTTYSCIAYLNERGEPVTLPNQEGELATPSVVLFDGDKAVVGTKALRNAIRYPDRVVVNSKRFMGDAKKRWTIDGRPFTPVDIAGLILKKLLSAAQEQIGPIEQAVVTVPAQFSDAARHATIEAGHRAGLQRVDIINEPVAAALCYVLGTEGLWFEELAAEQRIMVYDLGGGTFDLSLVSYQKDEVSVVAGSGDLNLGGIDWNQALMRYVADQFHTEFGEDPWADLAARQYLANEAEQAKRSLSVRPKAAMACKVDQKRKAYQMTRERFEELTRDLVEHTAEITQRMLKDNGMGWAHVDVVLTTGGASRMPMVRNRLKELSGTTLNTSLSPDLSIAHGATYYAGMLLTNDTFAKSILSNEAHRRLASVKQRSVNARALGILVRHPKTGKRSPHYILPANTPLPADVTNNYGTVVPNQKRVHLQIVESGIAEDQPPVKLGSCIIDGLPPNLPEGSEIAVTISYDSEARVHVSAKDVASGKRAQTEIVRQENVVPQLAADHQSKDDLQLIGDRKSQAEDDRAANRKRQRPESRAKAPATGEQSRSASDGTEQGPRTKKTFKVEKSRSPRVRAGAPATDPEKAHPSPSPQKSAAKQAKKKPQPRRGTTQESVKPRPQPGNKTAPATPARQSSLEGAEQPVPLCNECGEPLDSKGRCPACGAVPGVSPLLQDDAAESKLSRRSGRSNPSRPAASGGSKSSKAVPPPLDDDEIIELEQTTGGRQQRKPKRQQKRSSSRKQPQPKPRARKQPQPKPQQPKPKSPKQEPSDPHDVGEQEFWKLVDE